MCVFFGHFIILRIYIFFLLKQCNAKSYLALSILLELNLLSLKRTMAVKKKKSKTKTDREWVSCLHSFDFWYMSFECVNTVQSTFHVVLCLLYRYWDIHHFISLFISYLFKMLKWQRNPSMSLLVKTFVKNLLYFLFT